MKTALLTLCVMLLAPATFRAQDAKPNLTGTWTLDVAKSDFGPMPPPESIVYVVDHKDPQLKITSSQKGPQGEFSNTRTMTTDGKEATNTMKSPMGEQQIASTSTWKGKQLVTSFRLDIQGNAVAVVETLDVSDDGKVLTLVRTIDTGQGDLVQKAVFNKQ